MLLLACPGQGAQSPGMLTPWLELPVAATSLARAATATGLDLVGYGTTADADTIRDTAVAQPLLVAAALATARAVLSPDDDAAAWPAITPGRVDAVAGHSVGELAALALAGVLDEADALRLVAVRGAAMARAAAAAEPTGMSAVLGGDADRVVAAIESLGLVAANVNGGGQIVAAGPLTALAGLADAVPPRVRVIPLQVAGAFHTAVMAPAVGELERAAGAVATADPGPALLSNADGQVAADGPDALRRVVAQVAQPVRWDLCQERMQALGVTGLLELAPGGVLTGLARRSLPGVETVALKTPDDLPAARDLVRRHAGSPSTPTSEPLT